jgi:hypothetical protein
MRTVLSFVVMLFVAVVPAIAQAPAANMAGTWEVEDTPFSIILAVKDGAVTGQVVQGANKIAITDAVITGDTVSFKAMSPDGARTVTFTGKLDGNVMLFTREVQLAREGAPGGGAGLMGLNGPPEFRTRRASAESEVWTGTIRNAPTQRNQNPNPNPRPVTLSTRKMPDPHWRWRGGEKELEVRMFALPMGTFPLNAFELAGDTLSFSMSRPGPGDELACALTRQPDGKFAGRCEGVGSNFNVLIDLTPPAPAGSPSMR